MIETRVVALNRIEKRLEQSLGATGSTYSQKVLSLEKILPSVLIRQLQELPSLSPENLQKSLQSIETQLGLFSRVSSSQIEPDAVWSEAQRTEARAKQEVSVRRTKNAPSTVVSKLSLWLYDTRRAIPKRAHALSRKWQIPMTVLFALIGAAIGWFTFGAGAAALAAITLAAIGFLSYSETSLARTIWFWTRVVEDLLALFRGAIVVIGILVLLILGAGLAWLIARYWNVR